MVYAPTVIHYFLEHSAPSAVRPAARTTTSLQCFSSRVTMFFASLFSVSEPSLRTEIVPLKAGRPGSVLAEIRSSLLIIIYRSTTIIVLDRLTTFLTRLARYNFKCSREFFNQILRFDRIQPHDFIISSRNVKKKN